MTEDLAAVGVLLSEVACKILPGLILKGRKEKSPNREAGCGFLQMRNHERYSKGFVMVEAHWWKALELGKASKDPRPNIFVQVWQDGTLEERVSCPLPTHCWHSLSGVFGD